MPLINAVRGIPSYTVPNQSAGSTGLIPLYTHISAPSLHSNCGPFSFSHISLSMVSLFIKGQLILKICIDIAASGIRPEMEA